MFKDIEVLRREAESMGFRELRTVSQVVEAFKNDKFFLFINSDDSTSEYARQILSKTELPENSYMVLPGADMDATERAAEMLNITPSSPGFYMVENGKLVFEMDADEIIISKVDEVRGRLEEAFR